MGRGVRTGFKGLCVALRRLLPAEYENGFSVPKGWDAQRLYNGYRLPGARLVSLELVRTEKVTNDEKFSGMFMQWGQVSASERFLT